MMSAHGFGSGNYPSVYANVLKAPEQQPMFGGGNRNARGNGRIDENGNVGF